MYETTSQKGVRRKGNDLSNSRNEWSPKAKGTIHRYFRVVDKVVSQEECIDNDETTIRVYSG